MKNLTISLILSFICFSSFAQTQKPVNPVRVEVDYNSLKVSKLSKDDTKRILEKRDTVLLTITNIPNTINIIGIDGVSDSIPVASGEVEVDITSTFSSFLAKKVTYFRIVIEKKGKRLKLKVVDASESIRQSSNEAQSKSMAPSDGLRVEPRNYITIFERRNDKRIQKDDGNSYPDNKQLDEIWWMQGDLERFPNDQASDKMQPNTFSQGDIFAVQKHEVVDLRSILEIHFGYDALLQDIHFYGNLSLSAFLNDKEIEVSPYSVIGEEREPFSINAKAPKDMAGYLIKLLIEGRKMKNLAEGLTAQLELAKKPYET